MTVSLVTALPVVGYGFQWQRKGLEVRHLSTDQPKMSDVIQEERLQIICVSLTLQIGCSNSLHVEIACMAPFINMEISVTLLVGVSLSEPPY